MACGACGCKDRPDGEARAPLAAEAAVVEVLQPDGSRSTACGCKGALHPPSHEGLGDSLGRRARRTAADRRRATAREAMARECGACTGSPRAAKEPPAFSHPSAHLDAALRDLRRGRGAMAPVLKAASAYDPKDASVLAAFGAEDPRRDQSERAPWRRAMPQERLGWKERGLRPSAAAEREVPDSVARTPTRPQGTRPSALLSPGTTWQDPSQGLDRRDRGTAKGVGTLEPPQTLEHGPQLATAESVRTATRAPGEAPPLEARGVPEGGAVRTEPSTSDSRPAADRGVVAPGRVALGPTQAPRPAPIRTAKVPPGTIASPEKLVGELIEEGKRGKGGGGGGGKKDGDGKDVKPEGADVPEGGKPGGAKPVPKEQGPPCACDCACHRRSVQFRKPGGGVPPPPVTVSAFVPLPVLPSFDDVFAGALAVSTALDTPTSTSAVASRLPGAASGAGAVPPAMQRAGSATGGGGPIVPPGGDPDADRKDKKSGGGGKGADLTPLQSEEIRRPPASVAQGPPPRPLPPPRTPALHPAGAVDPEMIAKIRASDGALGQLGRFDPATVAPTVWEPRILELLSQRPIGPFGGVGSFDRSDAPLAPSAEFHPRMLGSRSADGAKAPIVGPPGTLATLTRFDKSSLFADLGSPPERGSVDKEDLFGWGALDGSSLGGTDAGLDRQPYDWRAWKGGAPSPGILSPATAQRDTGRPEGPPSLIARPAAGEGARGTSVSASGEGVLRELPASATGAADAQPATRVAIAPPATGGGPNLQFPASAKDGQTIFGVHPPGAFPSAPETGADPLAVEVPQGSHLGPSQQPQREYLEGLAQGLGGGGASSKRGKGGGGGPEAFAQGHVRFGQTVLAGVEAFQRNVAADQAAREREARAAQAYSVVRALALLDSNDTMVKLALGEAKVQWGNALRGLADARAVARGTQAELDAVHDEQLRIADAMARERENILANNPTDGQARIDEALARTYRRQRKDVVRTARANDRSNAKDKSRLPFAEFKARADARSASERVSLGARQGELKSKGEEQERLEKLTDLSPQQAKDLKDLRSDAKKRAVEAAHIAARLIQLTAQEKRREHDEAARALRQWERERHLSPETLARRKSNAVSSGLRNLIGQASSRGTRGAPLAGLLRMILHDFKAGDISAEQAAGLVGQIASGAQTPEALAKYKAAYEAWKKEKEQAEAEGKPAPPPPVAPPQVPVELCPQPPCKCVPECDESVPEVCICTPRGGKAPGPPAPLMPDGGATRETLPKEPPPPILPDDSGERETPRSKCPPGVLCKADPPPPPPAPPPKPSPCRVLIAVIGAHPQGGEGSELHAGGFPVDTSPEGVIGQSARARRGYFRRKGCHVELRFFSSLEALLCYLVKLHSLPVGPTWQHYLDVEIYGHGNEEDALRGFAAPPDDPARTQVLAAKYQLLGHLLGWAMTNEMHSSGGNGHILLGWCKSGNPSKASFRDFHLGGLVAGASGHVVFTVGRDLVYEGQRGKSVAPIEERPLAEPYPGIPSAPEQAPYGGWYLHRPVYADRSGEIGRNDGHQSGEKLNRENFPGANVLPFSPGEVSAPDDPDKRERRHDPHQRPDFEDGWLDAFGPKRIVDPPPFDQEVSKRIEESLRIALKDWCK